MRWLLCWRYISSLHSTDESQQEQNSCCDPALSVLVIFSISGRLWRSISLLVCCFSQLAQFDRKMSEISFHFPRYYWSPNSRSWCASHDWGEAEWNLVVVVHNQFVIQVLFEKKSVSLARECTALEKLRVENLHYKVLTLRAFINELKRKNQRRILSKVSGLKTIQLKYSRVLWTVSPFYYHFNLSAVAYNKHMDKVK